MTPSPAQLARTTHLAIGAHPDDLEFMAYHGIAACYQDPECWFTGVVCCNGAGSVQGEDKDQELAATRYQEQLKAAELGRYHAIFQLGHPSATIRGEGFAVLVEQLSELLEQCQPEVLYAHNPADSHRTHLVVLAATIAAVRRLPKGVRPKTCFGCEVWRDLDWLPARYRVALDVSAYPELAQQLNNCFQSQMAGGKNYPAAVEGRRRAHATFHQSHRADAATHLTFALDLAPLLQDDTLSLVEFTEAILRDFRDEIRSGLR